MHRLRILFRGLTRRCPRCGEWKIFERWFTMVDRCPRCNLRFEREEGYWVGAMTMNIGVTELLFAALLVIAVVLTWPDIPVWPLVAAGVAINGIFPVVFYPFSKTIWLAVDLAYLHPLSTEEIQ